MSGEYWLDPCDWFHDATRISHAIQKIWGFGSQSRLAFVCWLVGFDKILTIDHLRNREIFKYHIVLCEKDGKSVNRLFIHCSKRKKIGKRF